MSDRVWFIAGASRGFGRVWADAALKRGDKVAATARVVTRVSDLVERYGDAVLPLPLDVTDVDQVKNAVAQAWKPLYQGKDAPFSWRPEKVEVLDSGTLALSSGPVFDPSGKNTGTFTSIWRREADGKWRIVFDKGCDVCAAVATTPTPPPTPMQ